MEQRITRNTVYGIIAILILTLGFWSYFEPQRAYAQTFQIVTNLQYPVVAMEYQPTTDLFWVLTQDTASAKNFIYAIQRSTKAIVVNHNSTSMIATAFGSAQRLHDIGCGKTDCFVTSGNGGATGGIFKIPSFDIAPNIFRGKNVTGTHVNPVTNAPYWHIMVEDNVVSGFGTIRLYVGTCSEAEATCDFMVRVINGVTMVDTGIFTIFDLGNNPGVREHDFKLAGNSQVLGSKFVMVSGHANLDTGSQNNLWVYDSDMVAGCSAQPTPPVQTTPLSVDVKYTAGDSTNRIYVGGVDGNVYVYNFSCNLIQTLTTNDTGLAGDIRFIDYDAGRLFMQESGGTAKIAQLLVGSDGNIITTGEPTLYFPQPSASQSSYDATFVNRSIGGQMTLLSGNGQLWFIYTGTDKKIGILSFTAVGGGTGTSEVCIDTDLNGTLDLCFIDTNGDGAPDNGQLGALGAYRSNANLTSFGTDVFCAFGINTKACDNPDVKTNGVGLTLLALLIVGSYAMLVSIHHTAQKQLGQKNMTVIDSLNIHPILLVIMLVVDVGIAFYMQWIPDIIFYTLIAVMAGLIAFGIFRHFRGG